MSEPSVTFKATFGRPIIGVRDYVSVNHASGWPESFCRKEADAKLQEFVGSALPVGELLDNFTEMVDLKHGGRCTWSDVTGYLGRITKTSPDSISYTVAVAFWGQMVVREQANQGTKKCQ